MFELFIEIVLYVPQLLKYPGNIILHCLGYEVDLDEDSFAAYAWGIGLFLAIGLLIWLIIFH